MQPRIVCVGDAVALRPAIRVATCAGARVTAVTDMDAAAPHLGGAHILLVEHLHDRTPPAIDAAVAAHPGLRVVLVADPSPPLDLQHLLTRPWFLHLAGQGTPWFMEELTATLARLLGRPTPGVAGHLPWGAVVHQVQITGSTDKHLAFDRIEGLLHGLGIRGRIVDRLMDVADEMLMNAIYDAPVDRQTGSPLHAQRRRATAVQLAPADQPAFSFGSDGQKLVIAIRDPFGGLEAETVKRYIGKGLRRGDDQIDQKEGGAGLGLFLMFDALNALHVSVEPGRSTEVVGVMNIRGSMKEASITPKSLNLFARRR
ncbi:MAG: hypothetical protein H6706_08180 [Myxococcales bacterium]|nr:hypothetical protein [Myxococcales bacterium]